MQTQNIRIKNILNLPSPVEIKNLCQKLNDEDLNFILESRNIIQNILDGNDDRFLIIVGPCSIHNYSEALDYAKNLSKLKLKNIFIVMRTYFEKPRTSIGWKGFIYDPDLNNSNNINKGLKLARNLLVELTKLKIPIAVEFLDTISPQYLADLVSWGAIGARTTESQIHRQLASGLSMPVGFKNLTDGSIEKAINGINSCSKPHTFLGVNENGIASIVETTGNEYAHLILRGGSNGPNYSFKNLINIPKLNKKFIVDCSHDNSCKNFKRQVLVAIQCMRYKLTTKIPICGIMIESNINEGKQELCEKLKYGVSITDPCLSFSETQLLLSFLDSFNLDSIVDFKNIDQIRQIISNYDDNFLNGKSNIQPYFTVTNNIINFDNCLIKLNLTTQENLLLILRLCFSEKIAELKLKNNIGLFLKKSNNILESITKIDIESKILSKFNENKNSDIIINILDISKKIQYEYITDYLKQIKIGYLFGNGSFCWEAVSELNGNHIYFETLEELYENLKSKNINYALVPIYNIKIGNMFKIPDTFKQILTYSIPIELSLYTNIKAENYDILYIENHIEKEIDELKIKFNKKQIVTSTREGVIKLLSSKTPCLTVASKNIQNNLLITLQQINNKNNRTYFSLIEN